MTRFACRSLIAILAVVLTAPVGLALEDREGCEDHPLLSRMSGFFIVRCEKKAYSSHKFQNSEGKVSIEGRLTFLEYRTPEGSDKVANLEIIRNYTNAISAIGGQITYEGRYSASMTASVGDREVWVEVRPGAGRSYQLYVVEKESMAQQVVADAAAMLADLDRVGYTILHGLLFDTDKAVVKPESEAGLIEIAKLLRENAEMTAFIVGHTDMSGDLGHNLDLSQRRAEAVVEALATDHGIARDRLAPRGIGPVSPVTSNDTEAGRALNRRVELVKR